MAGPWEKYQKASSEAEEPPSAPTTREEFMALAEAAPKGSAEREKALNMAMRLSEPGAAGNALALTGAMAGGGVGAASRGLRLVRPTGNLIRDMVVAQGVEEVAKQTGIPGAGLIAEGYLASKGLKKGGSTIFELIKGMGRRKAAAPAAKAAAPAVIRGVSSTTTSGTVPAAVSAPRGSIGQLIGAGVPPAAAPAAVAPAASVAQATAPGSYENLLLQLKNMASTAAGRKQVLDYIKTQPPEVAKQLRELLGPAVRHRIGVK